MNIIATPEDIMIQSVNKQQVALHVFFTLADQDVVVLPWWTSSSSSQENE